MARLFVLWLMLLAPLASAWAVAAPDFLEGFNNRSVEQDKALIDSMTAAEINSLVDADGQTALFYCRHLGATLLLLAGANPNVANLAGRTPAFRAVSSPGNFTNQTMLDLLLLAHADVNVRDKDGITLLAWAAHEDNVAAARLLLLMGADPAPADVAADRNPLFFASQQSDTRLVELLNSFARNTPGPPTRAGADGAPTQELAAAARAARMTEVSDALAAGADINARDKDGATALFRAVAERRAPVVALLLLKGANPNLAKTDGHTPLMQCATNFEMASERMLMDLLLAGADVNAEAKDGSTALSQAVHCKNNTAAQWLIWRGANLDVHSPDGTLMQGAALLDGWPSMTELLKKAGLKEEAPAAKVKDPALFDAVRSGTLADVEAELKKGTRADVTNRYDQTALEWAVCYNKWDVVDLLLRHGANINHQHYYNGEHIMHSLATWKDGGGTPAATRIEYLIQRGASPDLEMHDGFTPLMVAAREGSSATTIEYLLKVSRNINARNKEGLTALGVARQHGHAEAARLLADNGATE